LDGQIGEDGDAGSAAAIDATKVERGHSGWDLSFAGGLTEYPGGGLPKAFPARDADQTKSKLRSEMSAMNDLAHLLYGRILDFAASGTNRGTVPIIGTDKQYCWASTLEGLGAKPELPFRRGRHFVSWEVSFDRLAKVRK
jgi:hypothetical protein